MCYNFIYDSWDNVVDIAGAVIKEKIYRRHASHIRETIVKILVHILKISRESAQKIIICHLKNMYHFESSANEKIFEALDDYYITFLQLCEEKCAQVKEDIKYITEYLQIHNIMKKEYVKIYIGKVLHFYFKNLKDIHSDHSGGHAKKMIKHDIDIKVP